MALVFSGYSSGTDAAEPLIPADEYNTNYKVGFYYDTSLDSNGNTVMRVARVALQSNLRWDPTNFYGYTQLFGYAYLSVKVGSASTKKEYGYDFNYEIYDPDGNPCAYDNPVGGPNEPALFAYDGIEYPETKPHAPTITLAAGSEDSTVVVSVFIEIRDGEIGYLYKGNKSAWISVPRNQWVVKLHPNGGIVDGSSATTVTKTKYYNQTLTIPTPTKTNAVFRGWYTNAQGTGNPVSASYTQNADIELWAIWNEPYAVTYVATDSDVTNMPRPNPDVKVWNRDYTISGTKPVRSGGYMFKEWNTRSDGAGTPYASGASYSTNAALTLYAIWHPPYSIGYNGNIGSDTASVPSNVPGAQTKSHGVALTLSSQKPTRPGYSFAHWDTNSSGTGTPYNPGDTYPASNNANQVLYAIWTPTVDSKAVTVNKSIRTGSLSSETEADEGGYAFIDFSYSFVGAASGTVSVSVGRTPEGGTRTPVPAARISGDTAKSKGVGYATLSGNVKVHDDGGGSLPITTRYKYDITVTFAGTSATGASYIEKAFFTISVLGDGVSGQTPGHGIAFGMPATRAAFEVGPSMQAYFWDVLNAYGKRLTTVGGRVVDYPTYGDGHARLFSNGIAFKDPLNNSSSSGNSDFGWIRMIEETANSGYLEIATGDDGNEPIYVRQYNTSNNVARQIELLNGSGNTSFPGTVTVTGSIKSTGNPGFESSVPAGNWSYLRLRQGSTFWDIATNSAENSSALDFRPAGQGGIGPRIQTSGRTDFANSGSSTSTDRYMQAAIQIRETNYQGAGRDTWGVAPRLAFHWGGRVAAEIGLASNGYLYVSPSSNVSATMYKLMYEYGTWGIDISGTANKASMLDGFNNRSGSQGWGNQTGTFIFGMDDATGGSIAFRRDNPSGGQLSMIIDGTVYVDEGRYSVLNTNNYSSYALPTSGGTLSGNLLVNSVDGSWTEGVRINRAPSEWCGVILGGANGSTSGKQDYLWWIGVGPKTTYSRKLFVQHYGSVGNTYFFAESGTDSGPVGLHVGGKLQFRTVLNSGSGYNDITLASSAANFNRMRIYFYTNEAYYDSVDIVDPNNKYVLLSTSRGENGSPNKLWTKSKLVQISGTKIYVKAYAELGINSNNAYGVNGYNYIGIGVVVGWNE